uniref:Uncharacterized protein n=1 Tax=Sphaerodactylus townsendi TaxID=933632 RepID=A0ACB8G035_9SAUR
MSWTVVGMLHTEMDEERSQLTACLVAAQPFTKRSTREAEKLRRDYEVLQVHTENVSRERNQLREELGVLQRQVALLMDERAANLPRQSEGTATDVAMTRESEEPCQGTAMEEADRVDNRRQRPPNPRFHKKKPDLRLARKGLKAEFAGYPGDLTFFQFQFQSLYWHYLFHDPAAKVPKGPKPPRGSSKALAVKDSDFTDAEDNNLGVALTATAFKDAVDTSKDGDLLNFDDPLNIEAAEHHLRDKGDFRNKVEDYINHYAR